VNPPRIASGHSLFDLLLRLARFGPVPLNHLVPMLDLNKRAPES